MEVALFVPCFIDQLYPNVARQMIKVLEKVGCSIQYNANQTCCGQPAFNAGFWGESKQVCNKFINDMKGAQYVVAPSASCVGFVRNYYAKLFKEGDAAYQEALELGARTYELTEFLVNVLKVTEVGASWNGKATYHDSCAASRECANKEAPRKLLEHVAGLELVEMEDVETCCGFGGTFAVKFEPISVAMGDQKINKAAATGASHIISTDMSCLMHIDGCAKHKNLDLEVIHIAEILASGY
jgi:L-lactate dehydrogenase complex protein LldE